MDINLPDVRGADSTRIAISSSRKSALLAAVLFLMLAGAAPTIAIGNLVGMRTDHTATLLPNGKVLIAGGNNGVGNLDTAELYDPATGAFTSIGPMTQTRSGHTATLLPSGLVLIAGGMSGAAVNTAELFDPVAGTFAATGAMTAARANHTATLLPDGRVLVAGGIGAGFAYLNTAEVYGSGVFTATGNMGAAREHHTATLMQNGEVLIAGGYNGAALNTVELYDAASGIFGAPFPSSSMTTARFRHTATLLPDAGVLIAGGAATLFGASLTSAEVYDFVFYAVSPMNAARQHHTATLLPNGTLLIAGGAGNGSSSAPLNTTEVYDPSTLAFTTSAPLGAARWNHTATLLASGSVLIAAGEQPTALNTAEQHDTAIGSFTATGTMGTERRDHTSTLLPNGKVLITGGNNGATLATAALYDPASGTFTPTTGAMSVAREQHTATLLQNGKVLIAGGQGLKSPNIAELYDSATGTFTTTGTMIEQRGGHTATLLPDGKVLIARGFAPGSGDLTTAELYDPATGTFTATGGIGPARTYHTATLLPGGFVLIAGGLGGPYLNTAELYDPFLGTFTATAPMSVARAYHTATLLPNGKVLIAGGRFQTSLGTLQTAELFDRHLGVNGGFTATGSMTRERQDHTATLLGTGKVLIAGGTNVDSQMEGELYDPAAGTFSSSGNITARSRHKATLLLNGKALITGGHFFGTPLNTAALYDVGLGYPESRRPVVTSASAMVIGGGALTLGGVGFRGDSEASGGSGHNSATNYPLLHLQRVDGDETFFLGPEFPWSDTSFRSTGMFGQPGHYRMTIVTNGIPSVQRLVVRGDFGAPIFFSATPTGATTVTTTWGFVGAALQYEVYRSTSLSGPYTLVGSTVTNTVNDTGLSPNTTYLYKVRAVNASGPSEFSPIDSATTVVFTDATLSAATIKAVHVTQLRTAVAAMRVAANLPVFTFSDSGLSAGTPIRRQHIIDLRTALDAARAAFGLASINYTNPVIPAVSTVIKAAHILELRTGTR